MSSRTLINNGQLHNLIYRLINLFDYASPSSCKLFDNWESKDPEQLVFGKLPLPRLKSYILAYGNYENWGVKDAEIKDRQLLIKKHLESLYEIVLPKNPRGTPMHPMIWQLKKLKPKISELLIRAFNTI